MMRRLRTAAQVKEGAYDLRTLVAPVLRGFWLRVFLWFLPTWLGVRVQTVLRRRSGLTQVLQELEIPEKPSFTSVAFAEAAELEGHVAVKKRKDSDVLAQALKLLSEGKGATSKPTVRDFAEAYGKKSTTPSEVAEKILKVLEENEKFRWFVSFRREEILSQARASTERYAAKAPLSVMDGVPFCVKDTLHVRGHVTTCGTAYLAENGAEDLEEAPVVTALRELGGMFVGKTNMHEMGLGVTGLNLRHGTPVNPWNEGSYPGGSSSGSAAAVASGLCPLSVGKHRHSLSFCGIFGLKMTHGREIPQCGKAVDYTVCCWGPMTNNVEDAVLLYALLSKSDVLLLLPKLRSLTATPAPLQGLRCGVYWEDSVEEVKVKCKGAVELLKEMGAEIVSVTIPELEYLRVAHTVTITSEMTQAMHRHFSNKVARRRMNPDVQANLTVASNFTAQEYIQAQCIRTRMGVHFKRVLEEVDCVLTPTTPITAPTIHAAAKAGGEHNLRLTSTIMRFLPAANFLGLPAASVPIGLDDAGRPIGLQVMGRHWEESQILKICFCLEQKLRASMPDLPSPQISVDLLSVR